MTYLKNVLLRAFESGAARQLAGGVGGRSAAGGGRGEAGLAGVWSGQPPTCPAPPRACRAAGELPPNSTMLPVLARLLEFSPQELQRVQDKAAAAAQPSAAASLFSGFNLPKLPGM